jgi:hypothetical protein
MTEKPLHVRVAEALGEEPELRYVSPGESGCWVSKNLLRTPYYDTDWAATGPLIEKHRIQVSPPMWMTTENFEIHEDDGWMAMSARTTPAKGPAPLVAVCNLILKLAEEKKLGINAST